MAQAKKTEDIKRVWMVNSKGKVYRIPESQVPQVEAIGNEKAWKRATAAQVEAYLKEKQAPKKVREEILAEFEGQANTADDDAAED